MPPDFDARIRPAAFARVGKPDLKELGGRGVRLALRCARFRAAA